MPRDDEIYKRARDERVTCTEFQKKFPERDKRIVMGWRASNLRIAREISPD